MKKISERVDIEYLIDAFYRKVVKDKTIGYIFTEVVKLDWKVHIPIMYNFWESVLLDNPVYKGNPMLTHISLNEKEKLESGHFDRWLKLWTETVNENFTGEKAELAIKRAKIMSQLIQFKIEQSEKKGFIQ